MNERILAKTFTNYLALELLDGETPEKIAYLFLRAMDGKACKGVTVQGIHRVGNTPFVLLKTDARSFKDSFPERATIQHYPIKGFVLRYSDGREKKINARFFFMKPFITTTYRRDAGWETQFPVCIVEGTC